MDHGSVIEQGTHETLMENEKGKYRAMVKRQQVTDLNEDTDEMISIDQIIAEDERQMGMLLCNEEWSKTDHFYSVVEHSRLMNNADADGLKQVRI